MIQPSNEDRPPLRERSDEELAHDARAGSLSAFAQLVERYDTRLVSFLRRRVGCEQTAEDLTQDAFVRAWTKIGSYQPGRRFSPWLFTIAARLSASHLRSDAARRAREASRSKSATPRPGAEIEETTPGSLWQLAAMILPTDQYEALHLRYVEDMTPRDIARALGRSAVSVRVALHRAKSRLAQACAPAPEGRTRATPFRDGAVLKECV